MAYHRKHGIDTRIVRIFNTYGPRMRPADGRVAPSFITKALRGEPLTIFGEGRQTRSFCYYEDLVEGIVRLMRSGEHDPVNIGNENEITILELARIIIRLCGSGSEVVFRPLPQDDPQLRRPDTTRAREDPGLGSRGPPRRRHEENHRVFQIPGRERLIRRPPERTRPMTTSGTPRHATDEGPGQVRIEAFQEGREKILAEVRKVITGQEEVLEQVLIALFAGGHCLVTGVPGLAKTLLIKTFAEVLDLEFRRIQFTPDLMPADITGTEILEEDKATGQRSLTFIKGPIFGNIVLADEINRTPPKTQAALLEAMQEHRVTTGRTTFRLDEPFFVLATQNPIELEGTYPLPEAQLDRFMFNIHIEYLEEDDEVAVARSTTSAETVSVDTVPVGRGGTGLPAPGPGSPGLRTGCPVRRSPGIREQAVRRGSAGIREELGILGGRPARLPIPDPGRQGAGPARRPRTRFLRRYPRTRPPGPAAPDPDQFLRRGGEDHLRGHRRPPARDRTGAAVRHVTQRRSPVCNPHSSQRHRHDRNPPFPGSEDPFESLLHGNARPHRGRRVRIRPPQEPLPGLRRGVRGIPSVYAGRRHPPRGLESRGTVGPGTTSRNTRTRQTCSACCCSTAARPWVTAGSGPGGPDGSGGLEGLGGPGRRDRTTGRMGRPLRHPRWTSSNTDPTWRLPWRISYCGRGDGVGLVTFDRAVHDYLPPSSKNTQWHAIHSTLDELRADAGTDMGKPLHELAESMPRRGLVILISDLIDDVEQMMNALMHFRFRGHEVLVFHIVDREELTFPFSETARFDDPETGERITVAPSAIRADYLAAVEEFMESIRTGCAKIQVDYERMETDRPLDFALFSYLSRRMVKR